MILPFDCYAALGKHAGHFKARVLSGHSHESLRSYWTECEAQPWCAGHPGYQLSRAGEPVIPIRFYGDDAT